MPVGAEGTTTVVGSGGDRRRAGFGAGVQAIVAPLLASRAIAAVQTSVGSAARLMGTALRPRVPFGGPIPDLPAGTAFEVRSTGAASIAGRVMGPDGPLVVLAHGWTNDSRIWSRVAHLLVAGGHQVVAYDQRGHGASSRGEAALTLAAVADDLAAVLEHVGAAEAVVVGHSMGGMAIQSLAARAPEVLATRARAVVLASTASDGLDRFGTLADGVIARSMQRAVGSSWLTKVAASPVGGPMLVRLSAGVGTSRDDLRMVAAMLAATPADVREELLVAMHSMDVRAALRSLTTPTLVVSGAQDVLTPPARSRRIAELLPDGHLVSLSEHGHMLPLEAPGTVAAMIASLARGLAPAEAAAVSVGAGAGVGAGGVGAEGERAGARKAARRPA